MKNAKINGYTIFFEVFITGAEPFILLSNNEYPSEGTNKIYFLRRYSIKYAMEDFVKYCEKVKEYKAANEVQ
jgi:hypothetical protein